MKYSIITDYNRFTMQWESFGFSGGDADPNPGMKSAAKAHDQAPQLASSQRMTLVEDSDIEAKLQEICPGYDIKDYRLYPTIFRGASQPGTAYIGDSTASRRRSANAVNSIYNIVISSYTDYPDRLESVIASYSHEYASSFSQRLFYVIPAKGTKVAVCSDVDIYDSYVKSLQPFDISSLGTLARALQVLCELVGVNASELRTLEEVKHTMARLDEYVMVHSMELIKRNMGLINTTYTMKFLERMKETKQPLYDILRDVLNPDKAGFKQFTFGVDDSTEAYAGLNREVWFSGKYMLVEEAYMDAIRYKNKS